MRKSTMILALLIIMTGLFLLFGSKFGIRIGNFVLAPSSDKKALEELTRAFLEDIQFKDFNKAATYHEPEEQKRVDIPYLLERLFHIKPEFLDIQEYEIMKVQIDSSGDRGRVLTRTTVKVLNTGELRKPEIVFYWHKAGDSWFMRLESSLDRPKKRDEK
ncbi:hypothetical protein JW905_10845 [bacterium]|nr:hypothetical protein [candidate division CSSED10-310 bacterium]